MLRKKIYTGLLLFTIISTFAQRGTRVGYMDMNIILENISEYNKASDLLDKNIEKWKKEIELKKIQLKQYEDQLNIERILLTPELIKDREIEIQIFASEIIPTRKTFWSEGRYDNPEIKTNTTCSRSSSINCKQIAEEKNMISFLTVLQV